MLQRRSIKHLLFTHCFGNNNFVINCRTVDLVDNCFSSLQKNSTPLDEMIALQYTTQRTKSTSSATLHFPRKRCNRRDASTEADDIDLSPALCLWGSI